MIRWLVALCLMASCSAASARDFALVKIRLGDFVDSYEPADNGCKPTGNYECVPFTNWEKYRITLLHTYAGHVPQHTSYAIMLGHGVLVGDIEFYALVEPAVGDARLHMNGHDLFPGENYVVILGRSYAKQGFCISPDDDDVKQAGLTATVEKLQQEYPCKER